MMVLFYLVKQQTQQNQCLSRSTRFLGQEPHVTYTLYLHVHRWWLDLVAVKFFQSGKTFGFSA